MIDNLRRWMGRTLDKTLERQNWQLFLALPVILFLFIIAKLIGPVKDESIEI